MTSPIEQIVEDMRAADSCKDAMLKAMLDYQGACMVGDKEKLDGIRARAQGSLDAFFDNLTAAYQVADRVMGEEQREMSFNFSFYPELQAVPASKAKEFLGLDRCNAPEGIKDFVAAAIDSIISSYGEGALVVVQGHGHLGGGMSTANGIVVKVADTSGA